jgi:hypothetical protein
MATGLRNRLRRLQKLTQEPSDVLVLRDGSEVHLAQGERFQAFHAAFAGQPHRLLTLIAEDQIDLGRSPGAREFCQFISAFQANAAEV